MHFVYFHGCALVGLLGLLGFGPEPAFAAPAPSGAVSAAAAFAHVAGVSSASLFAGGTLGLLVDDASFDGLPENLVGFLNLLLHDSLVFPVFL